MLGAEARTAPEVRRDLGALRTAYAAYVAPCGAPAINRLESLLERKFALAGRLADAPAADLAALVPEFLATVLATRAHRPAIVAATPPARFAEAVRRVARGPFAPRDLPRLAAGLAGAPPEVLHDLAAELAHAAAPDRLGLLTRWVWNPGRRSGVLAELVRPPPEGLDGAQAALGEARLQLTALGFPSATFAAVDILLAMTYASRLSEATERSFQGGGIESLLPGPYGLAAMVLGVRKWGARADR